MTNQSSSNPLTVASSTSPFYEDDQKPPPPRKRQYQRQNEELTRLRGLSAQLRMENEQLREENRVLENAIAQARHVVVGTQRTAGDSSRDLSLVTEETTEP